MKASGIQPEMKTSFIPDRPRKKDAFFLDAKKDVEIGTHVIKQPPSRAIDFDRKRYLKREHRSIGRNLNARDEAAFTRRLRFPGAGRRSTRFPNNPPPRSSICLNARLVNSIIVCYVAGVSPKHLSPTPSKGDRMAPTPKAKVKSKKAAAPVLTSITVVTKVEKGYHPGSVLVTSNQLHFKNGMLDKIDFERRSTIDVS